MANTLTVTFQYMFLLVFDVPAPLGGPEHAVLFPDGRGAERPQYPHTFSWSTKTDGDFVDLRGDVTFASVTAGAGPVALVPDLNKLVPSPQRIGALLDMRDVPKGDVQKKDPSNRFRVRPELIDRGNSNPDGLGGRVWMPTGGLFSGGKSVGGADAPHCYLIAKDAVYDQNLADQFTYQLPLSPQPVVTYGFRVGSDFIPLGTTSAARDSSMSVVFRNVEGPQPARPLGYGLLEDFVEMYRLTRMGMDRWPVPTLDPAEVAKITAARDARLPKNTSDVDRPICGGGTTCP